MAGLVAAKAQGRNGGRPTVMDEDKLAANITTFVDQIRSVKPTGVKGNYIKSITVSATMSPGIPVSM